MLSAAMNVVIKVKPGSKKEGVSVENQMIVVRVRAQAVDGKANDAVVRFLSELLNIPKARVGIVTGHTSRLKRLDLPEAAAGRLLELAER